VKNYFVCIVCLSYGVFLCAFLLLRKCFSSSENYLLGAQIVRNIYIVEPTIVLGSISNLL